jgi:CRISPR-associated protein Cas2
MFVVVTYYIADDKRRLHVSDELQNFGARVNYSVFECLLEAEALSILKERLVELIDQKEDNVRFYVLCEACVKIRRVEPGSGRVLWICEARRQYFRLIYFESDIRLLRRRNSRIRLVKLDTA